MKLLLLNIICTGLFFKIILFIIGIIVVLFILGNFFAGGKNIKMYGSPRIFLMGLLNRLKSDLPRNKIIFENSGRIKMEFLAGTHRYRTDFIYFNNHIQVCITFDSMFGSHLVKTFNCPYNAKVVEDQVMKFIHIEEP